MWPDYFNFYHIRSVSKYQDEYKIIMNIKFISIGFLSSAVIKNLPANVGDARDLCSIPGWGRSPGVGNGNPLQYSWLENRMTEEPVHDRLQAHWVPKSQTQLSDKAHTHTHTHTHTVNTLFCRSHVPSARQ